MGTHETDVCVLGAGYSGLSTALHLAAAGHDVRLLEAHVVGWGASGRNGGQVNPGWKVLPSEITARYGRERGLDPAVAECLEREPHADAGHEQLV